MNREEAEDYVYKSFMKASKSWNYSTPDSLKRRPEYSHAIIRKFSTTPSVVITGSKGKGSVAVMISSILQQNRKVGLFTSPHITDFLERFRVNGKMISESDFISGIEEIKPEFDRIEERLPEDRAISPIGIQTAVALNYFNRESTDFNVLECGKGARYDDVNNVIHKFAVINTIFLEHTRELGKTLKDIAEDKASVITDETEYVFVGVRNPEVLEVIQKRAKEKGAVLKIYGRDFHSENIRFTPDGMIFDIVIGSDVFKDIALPLFGEHQARNAALALALCRELDKNLLISQIKKGFEGVKWPGRLQKLSSSPFILLDACINAESTRNVKETLDYLGIQKVALIVGIPDDKDFTGVAEEMKDYTHTLILTKSQNPHYLFTSRQKDILNEIGIQAVLTENFAEAKKNAESFGIPIVILGTTSLISEVLEIFS